MQKRNLIVALLMLCTLGAAAQKTASGNDPEGDYKKGIELFEQKKFGAAKNRFEEIINLYAHRADAPQNVVMNSSYYRALCSKELFQPEAEQYFLNLLADYGENPTTRLAYYHLGDIYYNNKKYDIFVEAFN